MVIIKIGLTMSTGTAASTVTAFTSGIWCRGVCEPSRPKQVFVVVCPCVLLQVLSMSSGDIDMLIRLWQKFKVGVDESPTC